MGLNKMTVRKGGGGAWQVSGLDLGEIEGLANEEFLEEPIPPKFLNPNIASLTKM